MAGEFGQMFKRIRIASKVTLREFCAKNGFDPSNMSRMERGLQPPPQSRKKLEEYAIALGVDLGSDEWLDFCDLASVETGRIPDHILSDEQVVSKLPLTAAIAVEALGADKVMPGYRAVLGGLSASSGSGPRVADLFAGAGGLGLGFESAGFDTVGFESDPVAVATYAEHLGNCFLTTLTPETDFRSLLPDGVDAVIGGPPCQPYSRAGSEAGPVDPRDGVPTFMAAVRSLSPKVVVMENVPAMLRWPGVVDSLTQGLRSEGYDTVDARVLKAEEYHVPQRRRRLFIVAVQPRCVWRWPTRSDERFTVSDAFAELSEPDEPRLLTASMDEYVARYEAKSKCARSRDLHPDDTCRTVTCRNLGGATADMLRLRLPDGARRRLTMREGARLQGFPDWYRFSGSEASQAKQIGNAVPPPLAKALAVEVMRTLFPF